MHDSPDCGQFAADADGTLYRVYATPADPTTCTSLNFSGAKVIKVIDPATFDDMTQLQNLTLSNNAITKLDRAALGGLSGLVALYVLSTKYSA